MNICVKDQFYRILNKDTKEEFIQDSLLKYGREIRLKLRVMQSENLQSRSRVGSMTGKLLRGNIKMRGLLIEDRPGWSGIWGWRWEIWSDTEGGQISGWSLLAHLTVGFLGKLDSTRTVEPKLGSVKQRAQRNWLKCDQGEKVSLFWAFMRAFNISDKITHVPYLTAAYWVRCFRWAAPGSCCDSCDKDDKTGPQKS